MFPCKRDSSSLVEASKLIKYGSSSSSDSCSEDGGNLLNCERGMVFEGGPLLPVGDTGVPVGVLPTPAFSLAEAEGIGRYE